MSQLENLQEQLKNLGARLSQQIQESPTYAQAKDRYDNLSPAGQKMTLVIGAFLILFIFMFIPMTNLSDSQTTLSLFEERRNLIRDLYKTYRDSSAAPDISIPPPSDALRSSVESILMRAELLPEQKLGVSEVSPEGRLIPADLVTHVLQVQLAKLNLKQIVDIGSSIASISNSVKMKDMSIIANRQDTRYFDVTFKLYSLKVPSPNIELPAEPARGSKNARGSDQ